MAAYKIELGDYGHRILLPGGEYAPYWYGSEASAKLSLDKFPGGVIVPIDTRAKIADVVAEIKKHESEIWEEYIMQSSWSHQTLWPAVYRRIAVYVIRGGSEGMYLHVDVQYFEGSSECVIVGKTLTGKHTPDLWQSAFRIAAALDC